VSINDVNITETIAKVEKTLREDKRVPAEFRSLVELLLVIVKLLVDKLGLNSRNSSKPPSSDPNRPRGRRKQTGGEKRKPGGQPGHKGAHLKPVDNPDVIETIDIDRKKLSPGRYTHVGYEKRQLIDIVVSRKVTEYQAEVVKNERGVEFVAKFPEGVTRPVQYGTTFKAKAVYMSQFQLIPFERIEDYFRSQCSIEVSTGSLFNFNKQAFEGLEKFEKAARQELIASALLHNDETGINVNGKLKWLHSASNEKWTLFFPHEKRGTEAMEAMGILPHFKGISVHDHWKPYLRFPCDHAFCNAHHLRELERAWEQDGQRWAKNMKRLLIKINDAVDKAGGKLSQKKAQRYLKRYRSLLRRANQQCPEPRSTGPRKRGRPKKNKARNLLERLRDYETEVLRFMTDERVPFTNNLSERDIRMTKVQQKISGCFRSTEGAQIFSRVRSYLSTCRKHGVEPTEALRLLFAGKLPHFIRAP
jgi:transposase